MAKSIFTQVTERQFTVMHEGNEYEFGMAKYLDGLTEEVLLNEEKMTAWAKSAGVLHGLLCGGLRDDIIKQRALVRLKDKDGNAIVLGGPVQEELQEKIHAHTPPVITKPGAGKPAGKGIAYEKMAAELLSKGMPEAMIIMGLEAAGMEKRAAKLLINELAED